MTRRRRAYTEMDDLLDDEIRLSEPLEKKDLSKVIAEKKHGPNSLPDVIKEKQLFIEKIRSFDQIFTKKREIKKQEKID